MPRLEARLLTSSCVPPPGATTGDVALLRRWRLVRGMVDLKLGDTLFLCTNYVGYDEMCYVSMNEEGGGLPVVLLF